MRSLHEQPFGCGPCCREEEHCKFPHSLLCEWGCGHYLPNFPDHKQHDHQVPHKGYDGPSREDDWMGRRVMVWHIITISHTLGGGGGTRQSREKNGHKLHQIARSSKRCISLIVQYSKVTFCILTKRSCVYRSPKIV